MRRIDREYTMITFEEDKKHDSNGIDGHRDEDLFYLSYEDEAGNRIGLGIIDYGTIKNEIVK